MPHFALFDLQCMRPRPQLNSKKFNIIPELEQRHVEIHLVLSAAVPHKKKEQMGLVISVGKLQETASFFAH